MVKDGKGYMFKWWRIGRGICSMGKDWKKVYISWLRNIKMDMFNGEG